MDDVDLADLLPRPYLLALQLDALGANHDLIANCLGVEVESVDPMLRVAQQKVADARIDPPTTHPAGHEPPGE